MPDQRPPRRRFQFRLRTLLIVVAECSGRIQQSANVPRGDRRMSRDRRRYNRRSADILDEINFGGASMPPLPRSLQPTTWSLTAGVCILLLAPLFARAADTPATVKLIFVGDIMLARDEETGRLIERGKDPFEPFAGLLKEADVAVGNLECVIAGSGEPADKPFRFLADPRCIPLLNQHFSALTVANNHAEDFGARAFAEQCERLQKAGVPYFGGGRNTAEAHQPWIVERHGIRIALLGYCDVYSPTFRAEENRAGVARSDDADAVATEIKAAREKYRADIVIPFLHWGWQYRPANDRQRQLARKMIDAGADFVVGAHPHVTQGAEYYSGRAIVYSLGNFLFSGFQSEETQTGWTLRLTVNKHGMVDWDTIVAQLDKRGVPHPRLEIPSPSGHTGSSEIVQQSHDSK
jgi:poly-gamma-glutamate synthesis protein (capsule biosynthesis protein)